MSAMTDSYPSAFGTPGAALRHHAARRPDAEALCFPLAGARLSFAGWLDRAENLARGLPDLGLEPGQHVALLAENRLEWPVTQLGFALAARHAVGVRWRPLHLPRLIDAIDGRRQLEQNAAFLAWYKQDLQDLASLCGLALHYRPNYPLRPTRALRASLRAGELGRAKEFILAVFRAYWSEARDISSLKNLARIGAACGLGGTGPQIFAR